MHLRDAKCLLRRRGEAVCGAAGRFEIMLHRPCSAHLDELDVFSNVRIRLVQCIQITIGDSGFFGLVGFLIQPFPLFQTVHAAHHPKRLALRGQARIDLTVIGKDKPLLFKRAIEVVVLFDGIDLFEEKGRIGVLAIDRFEIVLESDVDREQ